MEYVCQTHQIFYYGLFNLIQYATHREEFSILLRALLKKILEVEGYLGKRIMCLFKFVKFKKKCNMVVLAQYSITDAPAPPQSSFVSYLLFGVSPKSLINAILSLRNQ